MLQSLSVHTKVRRLGYLKLMIRLFLNNDFFSISTFNFYFEKLAGAVKFQSQLNDYLKLYRKDDKGLIEITKSATSSIPYIKFAEDLNLIGKSNYSYILTKYSKVYKNLMYQYEIKKGQFKFVREPKPYYQPLDFFSDEQYENVFALNLIDISYFLFVLLEKDFLFLKSILRLVEEHAQKKVSRNGVKYFYIKTGFNQVVVNELGRYLNSESLKISDKQTVNHLIQRFTNTELKIRSFESIIEPRIGWLIDLGLIDSVKHNNGILSLTREGKALLYSIDSIFDVNSYLEGNYIKLLNSIYNVSSKRKPTNQKIEKYLAESIPIFKTLAPNRIPASQAILYCSLSLLLKDGNLMEYSEVKQYLFDQDGINYIVDWFPSENDGSIKKIGK